jgi:hypothetical protein
MYQILKKIITILHAGLLIVLPSCTAISVHPPVNDLLAYTVKNDDSLLNHYMPVFLIENHKKGYNLIGTPSAKADEDKKKIIYVNPAKATIYTETRIFKTSKGRYKNLIYRIHFEKIPGGLTPFYLGKGKNTGLITVVTLNNHNKPILYTTVHTCGCYIAFVPTSHMPENIFPDGWNKGRQSVDFENLPGILEYGKSSHDQEKTVILIRDGSHRVRDIWLSDPDSLKKYNTVRAQTQPTDALKKLELKYNKTTSFFENSGSRKGYVKESHKIREQLFMSWWTFDLRIGEDKMFGKNKNDGILFYTSLKPWAREKSDMRDFIVFLRYWNWEL